MAHCPPERLADVASVLADVRTWPGVLETRPCVFYLKRQPFLHFHLLAGGPRRRADVKSLRGWVSIELPAKVTETGRRALARELRQHYGERMRAARPVTAS